MSRVTFLLIPLLLAGCTHTYRVQYQPNGNADEVSFEEAHTMLEGREAEVELADGRSMPAQVLRVEQDSTIWMDEMTDRLRFADTPQIEVIRHPQPDRAARQGALVGAVGGGLLGLATGFGLLGKQKDDALLSESGFVLRFVVGGAVTGTALGAMLGPVRGAHDNYVYPDVMRTP